MKIISIISKSTLGEKALDKNIKEYYKMPIRSRRILKRKLSRRVSKNPLTLTLNIKNSFLAKRLDEKKKEISKKLEKEGAKEHEDYEVVIVE